ncbi:MAG: DUF2179 domain-containing protein [Caldicoprobacter oshimai]|uniref:Uncharacterized 5xTM membrane BCR, YitT family COG1284 n=1 Tax=Caldicoprobacter faecalis TaxID=937334 RepID=A0A1I5SRD1_9FIRM|nr:DUF2179 domain-containing protein [Caldicoprobacter faecalis]PZN09970.1 MAG: DUF2179 domain-containing protein [Caldicoprobacter oshimai]SFP73228.1 Uncharacterised 5xTM membrane BCR, YitT family COG1284 [Caldicoprobacter faecalis]
MIAAIFGGLISGTGTGIVIRNRGSLGGTDIISLLIIYMVVRTMELSKLREVVHKVDPGAFMSIIDTREVEGKGFSVEEVL